MDRHCDAKYEHRARVIESEQKSSTETKNSKVKWSLRCCFWGTSETMAKQQHNVSANGWKKKTSEQKIEHKNI